MVDLHHRPDPGRTASSTSSTATRRRWSRSCRRRGPTSGAACSRSGRWQFPLDRRPRRAAAAGDAVLGGARGAAASRRPIVRMPANFPPSGTATRELSGMGTPDMLGTYGTFSFFTSRARSSSGRTMSGGMILPFDVIDEPWHAALEGRRQSVPGRAESQTTRRRSTAYVDRRSRPVKHRRRRRGAGAAGR